MARYKSTARDLGAFICFEDEAGQGLRPPKGRTWAPRGARPVVKVRGTGGGRVSIAGVACYRPGDRPHLFYRLPAYSPDLNPAEGIWSLLKRSMINFAAADLDGLVRIVKRKLKKIQYRPHLIDGCLGGTGLTLEPW